jgi:hypothetical protein
MAWNDHFGYKLAMCQGDLTPLQELWVGLSQGYVHNKLNDPKSKG